MPNVYPLSIDWNPELYKHYTQILKFGKDKVYFDDIEFSVDPETKVGADIVFTMMLEDKQSKFRLTIDKIRINAIMNNYRVNNCLSSQEVARSIHLNLF